jgi:PAS domain S-box-containing protein
LLSEQSRVSSVADVDGDPIVGGAWLARLFLALALVALLGSPLALIVPGADPVSRFGQALGAGIAFLLAAGIARAGRRRSAVALAAAVLLGGSILGAASPGRWAAESLGVTIITAVLVLPAISRRATVPSLAAIGAAGLVAIAISRFGSAAPDAAGDTGIGSVVAAGTVLVVALVLVGWVHLRLERALERARSARSMLNASEVRYRTLFMSSPNAVLVFDSAGRVVDASDRAAEVFGHSTAVLRTLRIADLVPPAARDVHHDHVASFNASPASRLLGHGREVSAIRADGTEIPVEIGLSWFDTEDGQFATAVVVDLSASREAARAVREATETIRAVFDASPAGIAVTALDGTVRLWNRAMAGLTGFAEADAVGRPDPSVPEDRLANRARIRAAVARTETVAGAELVIARSDGSRFPAVGSFGPLHDAAGTVVGVVTVVEDVTVMRSLEAQVNRKDRLQAVGQLAGGIAHDINNVLTAIGGFAALSLDDIDPGQPVDREAIATIAEGAARTSALTRQLLAFARRDLRPAETLALGAAVRAVEPMLRGLIGEHIALTVATSDEGHVRIAGSQVEQLVINLVVNARDALPNGGSIRVEVANLVVADDTIGGRIDVAPGPYVALSVTDDGTGMLPEVAEHVFDPFFTTKGPDEGTGLGLATVHGIVTGAGGHVWLYSEPGVGTTFRIILPQVDALAEEAPGEPEAMARGHETILLVEDDHVVRVLATRVLERAGFAVLVATGGEEALALADGRAEPIDLLLTDVIMPGMLGPELAGRLVALRPGLPVLFTSGYTAGGAGLTASIPSDARFLDKPFSPRGLVEAVRAAIDDGTAARAG